jgi:exosortase/archaeosortase family protein
MRYDRKVAAVLLLLAIILILATSLFITPTTISDTDPSTYAIVPVLMLPLFILFSMKGRPEPKVTGKDVALGIALFAAFILLTLALRLYFTLFFVSFRLDMLLMPLAIISLVTLLFGAQNVSKFRGAIIYSLLASPAVLYPILIQFNAFTQLNTMLVYWLIKPFISGVQYLAPMTIEANQHIIAIGQACVSIGIFVALALFLIPVAYFYDGKVKKKALWVASGVALLFLLNFLRMLGISLVWLGYGPNATALLIHGFIGTLMFYIIIIVMLLVSRFYSLGMSRPKQASKKAKAARLSPLPAFAAIAMSLIYLLVTLNYSTSLVISPLSLGNRFQFNYSNTQISSALQQLVSRANFTDFVIASANGSSALFTLTNKTISGVQPIYIYFSAPTNNTIAGIEQQNKLLADMQFFNRNGTREEVYLVSSNNTNFIVYDTNLPIQLASMSTATAGVLLVMEASELPHVYSCSNYDTFYSGLLDLPKLSSYNQSARQTMLAAECFSDKLVWG